jgi:hypothetical protein
MEARLPDSRGPRRRSVAGARLQRFQAAIEWLVDRTLLAGNVVASPGVNGLFRYDPNGAFNSLATGDTTTDSFAYTVSDDQGETSVSAATVTITITGVSRSP